MSCTHACLKRFLRIGIYVQIVAVHVHPGTTVHRKLSSRYEEDCTNALKERRVVSNPCAPVSPAPSCVEAPKKNNKNGTGNTMLQTNMNG
jgi:hypothetical protein